jgi:nucleoside permease NupC
LAWRLGLAVVVLLLAGLAYVAAQPLGPRGRSALGAFCFVGVAALCSANLRAINWRTVAWGVALQIGLALFVLRFRPGYRAFEAVGGVVKQFEAGDVPRFGNLLGTKLVANEFVAYTEFQQYVQKGLLSERSRILASYALTGFANIASIGIQLGGIGAMAPARRPDLARLGGRALLTGFLVTLVNAAIAGVLL